MNDNEKPEGAPWKENPWVYSAWDGEKFAEDERVCAKCEFWLRHEKNTEGECRRYAPRATEAFSEARLRVAILHADVGDEIESTEVTRIAFWPFTDNYDWCGEFVLRTSKAREIPR